MRWRGAPHFPQRFETSLENCFAAPRKAAPTRCSTRGGNMALTFSLVDTWEDGKRVHVTGTVAVSGSYTTGGDTLDLSQFPAVASTRAPIQGTSWMDGLA